MSHIEQPSLVEAIARREQKVILAGLVAVSAAAWAYLLAGAGMDMAAMAPMPEMAMPAPWDPAYAALMLVMWWVMMAAMMLPSAAPAILLFSTISRRTAERGGPVTSSTAFACGYLLVWGGFSVLAVVAQWALDQSGLLSGAMALTSAAFGGILLIAAGVYQFTPLKQACLTRCRAPIVFFARRWRSGGLGALRMGAEHGLFCLGCCWLMMALLFYAGVMNLLWVAGLALLVLLEKVAPRGEWLGRAFGLVLCAWGAVALWTAWGGTM